MAGLVRGPMTQQLKSAFWLEFSFGSIIWEASTKTSCLSNASADVYCHLRSTLLTDARGLDAFSSAEAMPVASVKPIASKYFRVMCPLAQ